MPDDLLAIFDGQRPRVARNSDDFAYAVALDDGFSDALAGRPFRVPREGGPPAREGYSEGYAKGQERSRGN